MSVNKTTVLSAVTGTSLILAGLGAAAPLAMADEPAGIQQAGESASAVMNRVAKAEGAFSFDQGAITSTKDIHNVFCKAAATLCTAMPDYGVRPVAGAIAITGNVTCSFSATLEELAADAADTYVMGCACATNGPGGGAMVNAEVSGVSLASIAQAAQVA